jgi:hypothetical protein
MKPPEPRFRRTPLLAAAIALASASLSAEVVVTGEAPIVDVARTNVGTVVSKEMILQLPTSRNLGDVLTMTPGIPGPGPVESVPGVETIRYTVSASGNRPTLPPGTTADFGDGKARPFPSRYTFHFVGPNDGFHLTVKRPGEKKPVLDQPVRIPAVQIRDFGTIVPPNRFETPPVAVAGRTGVIRGSLSGDGTKTKVSIGGKPVRIVAENPRSVFFEVPDDTPAGYTKVLVEDGERRAEIPIAVLKLSMSADQLKMKRGQSTKFHVTITGPESWTDETWKAGQPSDLCDVAELRKKFPGFQPPPAGGDGFLMFSITNLSPSIVAIEEFARRLDRSEFKSGSYAYDGGIGAVNDGGFGIHGEVQAFIAPASAEVSPPGAK